MNVKRWTIVLLCVLGIESQVNAQALGGFPGLVRVPTADFKRDGSFYTGAGLLPKQTLTYSNYQRDALVMFSSLTFLPFMEIDLRLTKQLNMPEGANHTMDRSPSLRIKLLRERRWLPATVFGFHDFITTTDDGKARHFGSTYLVFTKRFYLPWMRLSPTLGYSFPVFQSEHYEFVAWFAGFKIQPYGLRWLALVMDYDSAEFNYGFDLYPLPWIQVKCALLNSRYFTFNTSMHFNLFRVFK